jgi:hypothetical protein
MTSLILNTLQFHSGRNWELQYFDLRMLPCRPRTVHKRSALDHIRTYWIVGKLIHQDCSSLPFNQRCQGQDMVCEAYREQLRESWFTGSQHLPTCANHYEDPK